MKKSTSNRIALFVMGAVSCAVGALIFSEAKSAIHEIEAFVLFLIGAVLYGSGSVVQSLDRIAGQKDEQKKRRQEVRTARSR